jgi:hypothetical protein
MLNRWSSNRSTWLAILSLLAVISLSCEVTSTNPNNANQSTTKGFLKTDCAVPGVNFPDITVDYMVDDVYDGGYLICNSSSTGAHGLSENYYISIMAMKPIKLNEAYQTLQSSIQRFVDDSIEWNAIPDIPERAKDELTFLCNEKDCYTFMITHEANVQGCLNGSGYGAEIFYRKYLVNISFQSCELNDTASYFSVLKNLEDAAINAVERVEATK